MQVWGKTGSKLYGAKSGADYVDNPKRFRIFCEACIEAVRTLPFGPGEDCVFVANDWHTAMVPVLLKVRRHARHAPPYSHRPQLLCAMAIGAIFECH